jgi:hypothetical protein
MGILMHFRYTLVGTDVSLAATDEPMTDEAPGRIVHLPTMVGAMAPLEEEGEVEPRAR